MVLCNMVAQETNKKRASLPSGKAGLRPHGEQAKLAEAHGRLTTETTTERTLGKANVLNHCQLRQPVRHLDHPHCAEFLPERGAV
jgi:hypothetical protein